MNAHTRDNCFVCGLADQEAKVAIERWRDTRTENDWERARSVAKRWTQTRNRHKAAMLPVPVSATADYPVGYDSDLGVYNGGLPELGKHR